MWRADSVRIPQPLHMSGCMSRWTTRAARSGGTMPDQRHWPGLEATVSTWLLVPIETIGIETALLVPELRIEFLEQRRRFVSQGARLFAIAELVVNVGHAKPGVVDVALQLAKRLGAFYVGAVRVHDGIAANPSSPGSRNPRTSGSGIPGVHRRRGRRSGRSIRDSVQRSRICRSSKDRSPVQRQAPCSVRSQSGVASAVP